MNTLVGTITSLTREGSLTLVHVLAEDTVITAIVLDTPESTPYLREQGPIQVLFKETEVIICKDQPIAVSIQNRLRCRINHVETGTLLCKLRLQFHNQELVSIITAQGAKQLGLQVGETVLAMIKTNEIMLSE
jgi:molybdate transport system regulatory protein